MESRRHLRERRKQPREEGATDRMGATLQNQSRSRRQQAHTACSIRRLHDRRSVPKEGDLDAVADGKGGEGRCTYPIGAPKISFS